MSDNYLLLVDTTRTQDYIFRSNRLRENIGASYLVAQATMHWVLEAVAETQSAHNVGNADVIELLPERRFEHDNLDAEVIYVGGGNGVIIFRDEPGMQRFVRRFTRRLLEETPGLSIYTASLPFDWATTDRDRAMAACMQKLFEDAGDEAKRTRLLSQPLLGLGVSVACRSTGLPARTLSQPVGEDDSPYPISAEIQAKLEAATPSDKAPSRADAYLRRQVPLDERCYRYPGDFDDMVKSKGEANYIAVVHADGDGIGRQISQLGIGQSWSNRRYIEERRRVSEGLLRATHTALRRTLAGVLTKLAQDSSPEGNRLIHFYGDEEMRVDLAPIKKGASVYYVPFRPLISGGDDVTFVCNGRIGLALAVNYLKAFEQATMQELGQPYSASAGVAIVRTHYPFARAYQLATGLMGSAKAYRRSAAISGGCLDWHFTVGGLYGDVKTIRRREYVSADGQSLTLRPVAVDDQAAYGSKKYRTWPTVWRGIDAFQESQIAEDARAWSTRRNKVKALRDALRDGKDAVEHFRTMYLSRPSGIEQLPEIAPGDPQFRDGGFYVSLCGYFDALELSDWFFPVDKGGLDGNPTEATE